ncbi:hypothetical protein LZ575_14035 [Antarcticibacterium sp. 1MA-6-2]|nr:hypothetical protein [Antarcticibacterium sp. 1MA-6-2]UJH90043.1 hypothetical protein LZ575_14035 [Antarcticibacterium sp. 1MA-6-2]
MEKVEIDFKKNPFFFLRHPEFISGSNMLEAETSSAWRKGEYKKQLLY